MRYAVRCQGPAEGDERPRLAEPVPALPVLRDVGDRYYETVCLDHLGDAHRAAGDRAAAGQSWRSALAVLDDLGHSDADAVRRKLRELAETGITGSTGA